MPKPQKVETVKELKDRFEQADAALLAEFRGLKVEEMKELRRELRAAGADFKVVKNTLTRIAVKASDLEGLLPFLEGSTAIAFVKGDAVAAAKGIDEVAKKYPALVLKGGYVEGQVLDGART
ncbi:MAG: 50S ribosomal protein L10, partial [Acidimicrobiia bacterium]